MERRRDRICVFPPTARGDFKDAKCAWKGSVAYVWKHERLLVGRCHYRCADELLLWRQQLLGLLSEKAVVCGGASAVHSLVKGGFSEEEPSFLCFAYFGFRRSDRGAQGRGRRM